MKTHYDTLQLEKNCTAKEIKDSFIKLSKKFHPDLNKSSDAHKKFVEVNEAYSVLGNSNSRHRYDATLSFVRETQVHQNAYSADLKTPYEVYADFYARQRRKQQERGGGPYITTSKLKMVAFCFLLMVFGSGLEVVAESKRRRYRSFEISRTLKEARDRRLRAGAEQTLRELTEALDKK